MTPTTLSLAHCTLCPFVVSARTLDETTRALAEHARASHATTTVRPQ